MAELSRLAVCALLSCTLFAAPTRIVHEVRGTVSSTDIEIPAPGQDTLEGLQFSLTSWKALTPESRIRIRLQDAQRTIAEKELHEGDPDFYTTFLARAGQKLTLHLTPQGPGSEKSPYQARVTAFPSGTPIEQEPNNRWQDATLTAPGETVFGSADDAPYLPVKSTGQRVTEDGADWYRLRFSPSKPQLVYFYVDLMERDNIPPEITVHRLVNGELAPFVEGEDPVAMPHEVQAALANKFVTRVITEPGDYYVRVVARHPEYKFRSRVYDAPPYARPQEAVQAAVDYILGAADSWHANTPRRGGVFDRVGNVHQETSLCVSCHATHFPQRAQLYAARQGYPIHMRQQLQFLSERFYNNPRPFYGFEEQGAVWARVISAPANVLGRMSHLMNVLEQNVTGERREIFHQSIGEYLKLYYRDRTTLPPDETNGNTPLVSTYEVAWYAWESTHDPEIAKLIQQDAVKNMVDLCYQTLALAAIDRAGNAEHIERNAKRILSLQRPSGQWAMRFEPDQPEAEFQTGHALWALQAAGIPREHPQVAKGLQYLLSRQQAFGGWFDPLQSYENFRTPFRETQMAVLALSAYYPESGRKPGWDVETPKAIADGSEELTLLDRVWNPSGAALLPRLSELAVSPDALVRQQAVEALGRLARPESLPVLSARLGDDSKLVRRTAAWAMRQVYSRHTDTSPDALLSALSSEDERVRWGATRVFAAHFSALARQGKYEASLERLMQDPIVAVRLQAVKGLWQFWFWTPQLDVKDRIEDAFLGALRRPQHPWIERNLQEGVYNLADENIRYLYNNWVPLLSRPVDRERAIRGRLTIEARLADKFANMLENGDDNTRKRLLTALTTYHLRRADVYDSRANLAQPGPAIYNRIGNDVEQIAFFGESNERIAKALLPLLDSSDVEVRHLAAEACLLVREAKFATVVQVSGKPGPLQEKVTKRMMAQADVPAEVRKEFAPPVVAKADPTKPRSSTPASSLPKPDEGYFNGYVRPILEAKGKDGYACVQCHLTHTKFSGSFQTALNVIDQENPEESLILKKPTSTSESEGVVGATTTAHGGGRRFEKGSPEYQTILNWVRGMKP